ncbi:MAG TPA: carboxypeptidase-like regulatory domain-containing protein [Pyrinomonadaceae bacterium]|nr:carboxypeptidase-like regulatory domain-containing protein [Pyrinomonadaceae bacterium]
MNVKLFVPLCVVLLCMAEVAAQPTCFASYGISPDCPNIDGDVVFLGRVVSLTAINRQTGERTESDTLNGYLYGEVAVTVEELLKGEASGVVEFRIRAGCYGMIERDKKYIFNLSGPPGDYHAKWSGAIDYMEESAIAKLLSTIRAHIRGEQQPRIFGTLYNDSRRGPINGTTVVADNYGAKFEAGTDSEGRYEFRELPEGEYKVYPLLPTWLVLYDDDKKTWGVKRYISVRILGNGPCGTRVDFTATDTGVISWRLESAAGKPVTCYRVNLIRLDYESRKEPYYVSYINDPALDTDYSFEHLSPGRYLIYLQVVDIDRNISTSFYHPGVWDERDARGIDLGEGQKLDGVTIKLALPEDR